MAAVNYWGRWGSRFGKLAVSSCRQFTEQAGKGKAGNNIKTLGLVISAAAAVGYTTLRFAYDRSTILGPGSIKVYAKDNSESVQNEEHAPIKDPIQMHREKRFLSFASIEYDGSVYMTPQDFLESILLDQARARSARRHLKQNEVDSYLKGTPSRKKTAPHFFGDLFDRGLISYTEYLFLLCILTKPISGFQIAFNMFDVDGDERVDKKEFLVLQQLMAGNTARSLSEKELVEMKRTSLTKKDICKTEAISDINVRSNIRTNLWNLLLSESKPSEESEEALQDTTLTVHFFGQKGRDVLKFNDFHRFMEGLQSEVLELEFHQYSLGLPTIQEEDFARILLRYTQLTKAEHNEYLERLRKRIIDVKHLFNFLHLSIHQGITFKDFKEFLLFLNNLDDFSLALRIYTYADLPISEADFSRAVKACTGQTLNSHLVHVVFQLFDRDGDGKLSQHEFLSVMKDRLHRGSKGLAGSQWDIFKHCIKTEMK